MARAEIDITATEVSRMTLGGTVLEFEVKGDPIPDMGSYVGYGAMTWVFIGVLVLPLLTVGLWKLTR